MLIEAVSEDDRKWHNRIGAVSEDNRLPIENGTSELGRCRKTIENGKRVYFRQKMAKESIMLIEAVSDNIARHNVSPDKGHRQ